MVRFPSFLVLSIVLAIGACGGNAAPASGSGGAGGAGQGGAGGGAIALSCANATTILANKCVPCHDGPSNGSVADLDLASAGIAQRLVGKPGGSALEGQCMGVMSLLNRSTLPATGILIDKINFKKTCGVSMPYGESQPLPATDLDCLQAWANGLVASVGN